MTRKIGYAAGVLAGALALAVACAPVRPSASGTEAPPDSITNPLADSQRAAVLEYARRLRFDSLPHGAGDRQRLTTLDPIARRDVLGPLAQLLPERRARGNTWPSLERAVSSPASRPMGPTPRSACPPGSATCGSTACARPIPRPLGGRS